MSLVGKLLIATPPIGDPNFERTVVLLLAHGGEGAFGVVLNRPTDTRVAEVAPQWADLAVAPAVVFVGGPVSRDTVLGLGVSAAHEPEGAVVGRCAPVDLHHSPEEASAWAGVRLFAGSAGWAPGQLEDELAEGAWWPVPAVEGDVAGADAEGLWGAVLRRQRGEVAWFANHPADPSAN